MGQAWQERLPSVRAERAWPERLLSEQAGQAGQERLPSGRAWQEQLPSERAERAWPERLPGRNRLFDTPARLPYVDFSDGIFFPGLTILKRQLY